MHQIRGMSVPGVVVVKGLELVHSSQHGEREQNSMGWTQSPHEYVLEWMPRMANQPRAAIWRNRDFYHFNSPLTRGVESHVEQA